MRTVEEIEKSIKNKYRGETFDGNLWFTLSDGDMVELHKLKDALNNLLTKLWNDEEVTDTELFETYDTESDIAKNTILLCFTNRNRLFQIEEGSALDGKILVTTYYFYKLTCSELNDIDPNKCRILEIEKTSFFGKPKPSIYGSIIINDKTWFSAVKLTIIKKVFNTLMTNINASKANLNVSAAATKEISSPSSSSNIAEIRKMYEDNIITKEEMIDLIKSITSK